MFLVIETATSRGVIAICQERRVVAFCELALGFGESRKLEGSLDLLFKDNNIKPSDLEFVAVGSGPGSYTGIRVGVASSKALSYAFKIPLVSLSSLEGFIPPDEYEGAFLSVIDARIGGVYLSVGIKEKGRIQRQSKDSLIAFDAFLERVKEIPCIVTPDFAPLKKRMGEGLSFTLFEVGPSPEQLASQAWSAYGARQFSLDGSISLQYLRITQAEMEKLPNKASLE